MHTQYISKGKNKRTSSVEGLGQLLFPFLKPQLNNKRKQLGQAWWLTREVETGQLDEFKASLGYGLRLCFTKQKQKTKNSSEEHYKGLRLKNKTKTTSLPAEDRFM